MTISRGGPAASGLDRALDDALRAGIDDTLETGELYPGERKRYPDEYGPYDESARRWQMPLSRRRDPPARDEPLLGALATVVGALRDRLRGRRGGGTGPARPGPTAPPAGGRPPEPSGSAEPPSPSPPPSAPTKSGLRSGRAPATEAWVGAALAGAPVEPTHVSPQEQAVRDALRHFAGDDDCPPTDADRYRLEFRFRPELTGVIMLHGIGPQLAGQTLLEWTRPIVTLLADASLATPALEPLGTTPDVTDPVHKANIDFSGETFPVIQLRIPGRTDVPPTDPRGQESRWIVTETWWAAEVRPPTLRTMMTWLGEQGGVGRIVQGIQENMLGSGPLATAARFSLQAFVSVIVSFVLLVFAVLLGLSRLIPFGPLRDFVALQLAASFITDWFGGARTLLRDPPQSANVRGRLVATVKALRAYGCRKVVIVAHSGGTMVSLQTLTDPAYPRLRVEKLITIGEALNLGWRLENLDQDVSPPRLAAGNRMAGQLARAQPDLLWRDFWATHDPACSGRPLLPQGVDDAGPPRFLAERVYNDMSITGDHGGYWDNDEHFLIPLIREIDTPTTDRTNSRFYSDAAESAVRARRKERVGLLALWRRATMALPVVAILAAGLVTGGGLLPDAGAAVLSVFEQAPGRGLVEDAGAVLRQVPGAGALHQLGMLELQVGLILALVLAITPMRVDRLWLGRPLARLGVAAVDAGISLTAVAVLLAAIAAGQGEALVVPAVALAVVGLGLFGWAFVARVVRRLIGRLRRSGGLSARALRDVLIVVSAIVLGVTLVAVLLGVIGLLLVFAGTPDGAQAAGQAETRQFVLGAIAALAGFQLLQRVGTWRWRSWDERERRALRRRPTEYPHRLWSYGLALWLSVVAVAGAAAVALGSGGLLGVVVGLVVVLVIVSVGKDIVDNDIDTGADPGTVVPGVAGPAAGAAAG